MKAVRFTPFLLSLGCGTVLALATACKQADSTFTGAPDFTDTTNIVFKQRQFFPDQKTNFMISASNEIVHLVSTIQLRRKDPCLCGHSQEVIFQKASGDIRVSFCDHCFDVLDSKNPDSYALLRMYKMPKEFYAEYVRLSRSEANWDISE